MLKSSQSCFNFPASSFGPRSRPKNCAWFCGSPARAVDELGSPFSQHALHMDSSLRSCPASMVSMTLGAEPLATPAPSKIDLKAASGFSLTDQYSAAGLTNFLSDISLDTSSGMFNCFTSSTNCFGSSIAHTEKRVKQQVLLANCHKAGRYTPRTLGSLSERAARHRAQSTPRRLQAQPCARHNAHVRLPAQHCGHSPEKRRLRAQPPHKERLTARLRAHTSPQTHRSGYQRNSLGTRPKCAHAHTHTGAATSSAKHMTCGTSTMLKKCHTARNHALNVHQ